MKRNLRYTKPEIQNERYDLRSKRDGQNERTTKTTVETMFTRCRYGAQMKKLLFPFCSHDASMKLHDTVTATVTTQIPVYKRHEMTTRLCGIV